MEITTDIKAKAHLDAGFSMHRTRSLSQKEWSRLQVWRKANPELAFKRGELVKDLCFYQYNRNIRSGMYFTSEAQVDLMKRKRTNAYKPSNYAKKIGATKQKRVESYTGRLVWGAKNRGIDFDISKDEMLELYSMPCFYCGFEPEPNESLGIDRLNPDTGYTYDNSVACCKWCNYSKHTMDFDTFARHIERVHSHLLA